jgi:hypothetical protein
MNENEIERKKELLRKLRAYKIKLHRQDTNPKTRHRLAVKLRNERTARKLVQGIVNRGEGV